MRKIKVIESAERFHSTFEWIGLLENDDLERIVHGDLVFSALLDAGDVGKVSVPMVDVKSIEFDVDDELRMVRLVY